MIGCVKLNEAPGMAACRRRDSSSTKSDFVLPRGHMS